jgi:hypothetical protein
LALTAADLERTLSTEEKVGEVVPSLLGIASPKGKAAWANFVGLKRMRDAVIHLKAVDQYPNRQEPGHVDENSVFSRFLTDEIANVPKASVELMFYFARVTFVPSWLEHPLQRFGIGR